MTRIHPTLLALPLAALLLAAPATARADEPASPAPAPTAPATDTSGAAASDPTSPTSPAGAADPAAEEARAHHRRGLELFDEGDYRLALVEFERSYQMSKSYKTLFNIGQVHFQLNNYARARGALEQYLKLGGDQIAAPRREAVEKDLATLRTRTATLTVRVNVADADILVNDVRIGKSPLEASVVDAGTLRIQVTHAGYAATVRDLTLVGGDVQTVTIELSESRPDMVVNQVTTGLPGTAIAGWIVTGILAAGAVGTGIAATAASSSYDTKRETPIAGSTQEARADLERQRDLVSALALTTDILAVSAVVAGGISLYLTLRDKPKPDAPRVRVQGAGASFSFGF